MRSPPRLVLCLLLALARPVSAEPALAQEALLQGVRLFRAERYEEALATFRRLEGSGAPTIGLYLGTTLHKLGRHEEALVAFRAARRAGLREPVVEYYQALSCYHVGLLARARKGFAELHQPRDAAPEAGPRLREGAGRFLQRIDGLVAKAPVVARFDGVLAAAAQATPSDALEWLEEAALLLPQLPDRTAAAARLQKLIPRLGPAVPAAELAALARGLEP